MCTKFSITSATFSDNYALNGGAIFISYDQATSAMTPLIELISNSFTNLYANNNGGVIAISENAFGSNPNP
jgi:predicted outer membrane repeat protein